MAKLGLRGQTDKVEVALKMAHKRNNAAQAKAQAQPQQAAAPAAAAAAAPAAANAQHQLVISHCEENEVATGRLTIERIYAPAQGDPNGWYKIKGAISAHRNNTPKFIQMMADHTRRNGIPLYVRLPNIFTLTFRGTKSPDNRLIAWLAPGLQ